MNHHCARSPRCWWDKAWHQPQKGPRTDGHCRYKMLNSETVNYCSYWVFVGVSTHCEYSLAVKDIWYILIWQQTIAIIETQQIFKGAIVGCRIFLRPILDTSSTTRWWFQTFFIFTTTWGNDPILTNIFQMDWNHHLDYDEHVNLGLLGN